MGRVDLDGVALQPRKPKPYPGMRVTPSGPSDSACSISRHCSRDCGRGVPRSSPGARTAGGCGFGCRRMGRVPTMAAWRPTGRR